MSRKHCVCCLAVVASLLSEAAVRNWTGGGDGVSWSDAANWDVAPAAGDSLVLTNRTTSLLRLTNDLGSPEQPFAVQGLVVGGSGAIHLSGNPLAIEPTAYRSFVVRCPFTNDVDMIYGNIGRRTSISLGTSLTDSDETVYGYLVQNGKIRSDGAYTFCLDFRTMTEDGVSYDRTGYSKTRFNGDILMPNSDISTWGGSDSVEFHFYGRVVAYSANVKGDVENPVIYTQKSGKWYLHHANNEFSEIDVNSRVFYVYGNNGLGTNVLLRTGDPSNAYSLSYVYFQNGTEQSVVDFGGSPSFPAAVVTRANGLLPVNYSGKPVSFVANGTNDTVCGFEIRTVLAVTWAPTGNYTLDMNRTCNHDTKCGLAVRRGTMRISGSATFKSVPEITVGENATFEMVGGSTSALTGLKTVTLSDGATFRLGVGEVTPFTANKVVFNLFGSAKIDLSCTVSEAVSVVVDGVPVAPGTYTTASWLTGTGSITVASPSDNYWTGSLDSDWNNAGNWFNGVPVFSSALTAYLLKPGATVAVSADAPTVKHLCLAGDYDKTTLNVNAALAVSNGTFTVGEGAEVKVGDGGALKYDYAGYTSDTSTPALTLKGGGTITVDGGSFLADRLYGLTTIGDGDASVTSTLSIVSGSCNFNMSHRDSFQLNKGGMIKMTGGTFQEYYTYVGGLLKDCFKMRGGSIDLSGDAVMTIAMNASTLFGDGVIRIAGTSSLVVNNQAQRCGFVPVTENGLLDIVVSGQGQLDGSAMDCTYVNSSSLDGSMTRITVSDTATAKLGNEVTVGSGANSTGEVVLKDSCTFKDNFYGIRFGQGGSSEGVATGILRMSGGNLQASGNLSQAYPTLRGLVIGCGPSTTATGAFYNKGLCYISGGTVTAQTAIHIGDGNAYGLVEQSGGTVGIFNDAASPVNIGNHHGTGVYRISGGTFTCQNGTVNVGDNDGVGTIELCAGTGTFTAKNLNLAGAKSTLKFVLGADGSVITPNVTGPLTIGTGAKLVIDSSLYERGRTVRLMSFGSLSGEFAESDMTFIGAPAGKIVVKGNDLYFKPNTHGMMLIFR